MSGPPEGRSALADAARRGTLERATRSGAFDVVVVGAGATGGLAAALLAEAGLEVLILNAGRPEARGSAPGGVVRQIGRQLRSLSWIPSLRQRRQPVQSRCYAWALDPDAFVDDLELPYETAGGSAFVWVRSRRLGGRLAVPGHGRLYYRLGPDDMAPSDDGRPGWPIGYHDLEPWYDEVERRLDMSGGQEGIPWLPDSVLAKSLSPTAGESALRAHIEQAWPDCRVALSRFAEPADFLEDAARTGRVTLREGAIAQELEVDPGGEVRGVRWVDIRSGRTEGVHAPLVFLCASALESTRLLLMSQAPEGNRGIGASSGALGANLMDHVRIVGRGEGPPLPSADVSAGRCLYLPRFDARRSDQVPGGRGYGVQLYHDSSPGSTSSTISMSAYGEMLPRRENHVSIHPTLKDAWGIPALQIRCSHGPAELELAARQRQAIEELASTLGVELSQLDATPAPPGSANHECGTARMGADPMTSVLDPDNQCWEARGLYVTDGSCLPSQGTQNPTLTYLALTARACNHALRGHASRDS